MWSREEPTSKVEQRQFDRLLQRLRGEFIEPNADRIRAITDKGMVVCVILDTGAESKTALQALGWDGASLVFEPDRLAVSQLARGLESEGRRIAANWIRRRRGRRVLVFLRGATVCFDLIEEGEMSVAPGTLSSP